MMTKQELARKLQDIEWEDFEAKEAKTQLPRNVWEYYFAIFQRLRRHLDLPFQLTSEGFATENNPAVDAVREALVNMLMHTDYFSPLKPRIRVFTDRIEFFNPGALPKPLEVILREDISLRETRCWQNCSG